MRFRDSPPHRGLFVNAHEVSSQRDHKSCHQCGDRPHLDVLDEVNLQRYDHSAMSTKDGRLSSPVLVSFYRVACTPCDVAIIFPTCRSDTIMFTEISHLCFDPVSHDVCKVFLFLIRGTTSHNRFIVFKTLCICDWTHSPHGRVAGSYAGVTVIFAARQRINSIE